MEKAQKAELQAQEKEKKEQERRTQQERDQEQKEFDWLASEEAALKLESERLAQAARDLVSKEAMQADRRAQEAAVEAEQ